MSLHFTGHPSFREWGSKLAWIQSSFTVSMPLFDTFLLFYNFKVSKIVFDSYKSLRGKDKGGGGGNGQ